MATKRRLKRRYRRILNLFKRLFFLVVIFFIIYFVIKTFIFKNYIDSVSFDNDTVIIKLNTNKDLYCILSDEKPSLDDKWTPVENNICKTEYKDNSNIYIKSNDKIYSSKDSYIDLDQSETIYIALNGTYKFYRHVIGKEYKHEYDKDIIKVENGIITGIKNGETNLITVIDNKKYITKVIVTSYITKRPKSYDYKKKYLSCNKYSEEENKLLDEILKTNINNVGYKTRAGAVEAARFLTLDFPYRINYFYENGRQTTNKVDGEGRYYHVGLYLNKSKYSTLTGSTTTTNKGPWGCSLYDYPAHRNIDNGLDCSGFVSWALLNAGFDVKDVGAGWSDKLDLTDYGEVKKLTAALGKSDTIKVGDLLHSEKAGGHIGIIVGKDQNYYYIAQALWFDEIGVIVTKAKKDQLYKEFPHVVLMDKYYKEDGYLTDMWY